MNNRITKALFIIKNFKKRLSFDKKFYLNAYPDVKKAGIDPFTHYIKYGINEHRYQNRDELSKKLMDNDYEHGQIYFYLEEINKCKHLDIDEKICVHLHLYYIDLSDEMISYLNNIPYKFDLYISVSSSNVIEETRSKFTSCLKNVNICVVEKVDNRGRDIYPLVCCFAERIQGYKYLCHIQTKKSLSSTSFTQLFFWRRYLLDSILGNSTKIRKIFTVLRRNETGLVFPEPYYNLGIINLKIDWWDRFPNIHYILDKVKVTLPKHDVMFPAGTMFWCKVESIMPILNAGINKDDFPIEQGILNDGSVAHAVERLFGIVPSQNGYKNYVIRSSLNHYFNSYKLSDARRDIMLQTFSKEWYNKCYPDVAFAKMDPLYHYQKHGFFEGRTPLDYYPSEVINKLISERKFKKLKTAQNFDVHYYLKEYKEVADALMFGGINPYEHYLNIGSKVGFTINDFKRKQLIESKASNRRSFAVVIPVYNSAEYLEKCLESAYNQTVENLHVVIVNDGSSDNSSEIIELYKNKYPDITTVINHTVNEGLSKTHQDGIEAVKEDYFTILDGDDWLELNFFEDLHAIAEAYDLDCVCCKWTRPPIYSNPGKDSQLPIDLRIITGDLILKAIANWKTYPSIHYGLNRILYLTSSWKSVNPSYPQDKRVICWEDMVLTCNFFSKCKRVGCVRNFYYHWFKNVNSIGSKYLDKKSIDDNFSVLNEMTYLKESSNPDLANIYIRNVDNSIITEFNQRLSELMKHSTKLAREVIEYFSEVYDRNLHLFNAYQRDIIETFIMEKYYQIVSVSSIVEEYVLLLDAVGINNIKLYFKDYFKSKTQYEVKYIQLSNNDPLRLRLSYMEVGCNAKIIITTGGWAIKQFHSNRPKIQLWHGMGAIKKVAPFDPQLSPVLAFCSSSDVIDVFSELFNVKSDVVKPFGSIVTDNLFDDEFKKQSMREIYEKYPELRNKKVYLWCPTFRGTPPNLYMRDTPDLSRISQFLSDDEVFLIKLHPVANNLNSTDFDTSGLKNIINVTFDNDLFKLLTVTNVFITDYSSALHYAMLMNIPVCFLMTDYSSYKVNPGLLIDLADFPGPICQSLDTEQLIMSIRNAVNFDRTIYNSFVEKHCGACLDGHSKERIYSEIEKLLNII